MTPTDIPSRMTGLFGPSSGIRANTNPPQSPLSQSIGDSGSRHWAKPVTLDTERWGLSSRILQGRKRMGSAKVGAPDGLKRRPRRQAYW